MTNTLETTSSSTRPSVLRYLPGWAVASVFGLLFLTLGMSYVEGTGEFSPSRGFRLLGSLFGGFWQVVLTLILSLIVLAFAGGILNDRMSKLVRGGMLGALFVGAIIVGALGVYKLVPVGSIIMIVIFMATTALQTWLEAKFNLLGGNRSFGRSRRASGPRRLVVMDDDAADDTSTSTPANASA